ncbi:MAG: cyclase family protein [Desulfobacteraceae bacterium]|nr:MAG: cyclase family protein [Desulfobacteraceae bacterium]
MNRNIVCISRKFVVLICLFFFLGCAHRSNRLSTLQSGKWVDLTWSFDEQSVYWPTNVPFTHEKVFQGMNDQGYYYSSFKFGAEEHGGTHFDAPIHFAENGNSVEKVPLEQLTGEGVVIDVTAKTSVDRDYRISTEDFEWWEKRNGRIPEGAIVLLNTGFARHYPDKQKYTGTNLAGAAGVENLHFPGLSPDAAKWLTEQRKIKAIGLDTPSIDFGQSKDFMTHRILFANNVTAYENLANLESLPAKGFWIVALPMKIKGGSGAPLRIVAFLPGP